MSIWTEFINNLNSDASTKAFLWSLIIMYSSVIFLELYDKYKCELKFINYKRPNFIFWFLSRYYYDMGLKNMESKKYNKSIVFFKRALKFDVNYDVAYLQLGKIFFHLGKIQSARNMLDQALKLNGRNSEIYLYLGSVMVSQGKFEDGINFLEQSYSLDRNNISVILQKGACLFGLRKIHLSAECYVKAIELANDNKEFSNVIDDFVKIFDCLLYKGITNFFEKIGIRYENFSINDNSQVVSMNNYNLQGFNPIERAVSLMLCLPMNECNVLIDRFPKVFSKKLTDIMIAMTELKLADKKKVFCQFLELTDWSKILTHEVEEGKRYYNLGRSFMEKNNLELAICHFKKALKIDGNYIDARKELGFAFAKSGLINEAVLEWEKVIASGVKDPELHKKIGDAYAKMGMLMQASNQWRRALVLERSNGEVR